VKLTVYVRKIGFVDLPDTIELDSEIIDAAGFEIGKPIQFRRIGHRRFELVQTNRLDEAFIAI
jgi:hypothetical protein